MNKKLILIILNLLGYLGTLIINFLATLPKGSPFLIGYDTTGALSDAIPNLFVPAGLTFSIWGVIYIFLTVFIAYQIYEVVKKKPEIEYLDKIGYFFFIASLANITWIFLWQYILIPYSLIAMLVLLVSLLYIYLKLNIGRSNRRLIEKFAVEVTFSIYLGWITVATIANVVAVLVTAGIESFGPIAELWTILVLIVATVITYGMLLTRKDIAYSLVIVWATFGIYYKQSTIPLGNATIALTALIVMIVVSIGIVGVIVLKLIKRNK
jgi:hypothetical protein